jgi:hypothetical protein
MSRFSGRQGRGALAALRARRRVQAEERNAATPAEFRRAYRLLAADTDEVVSDAVETTQASACRWPWKDAYENDGRARAAIKGMDRHRKGQGLHPYPCPAGHVHLGRNLQRASVAWRSKP